MLTELEKIKNEKLEWKKRADKIIRLQEENEYYADDLYWIKEYIKTNKKVIKTLTDWNIKKDKYKS